MQALTSQGPVIVEPKSKKVPIEYDEEIIMMLSDSYHVRGCYVFPRNVADRMLVIRLRIAQSLVDCSMIPYLAG